VFDDEAQAFSNINTLDELASYEKAPCSRRITLGRPSSGGSSACLTDQQRAGDMGYPPMTLPFNSIAQELNRPHSTPWRR